MCHTIAITRCLVCGFKPLTNSRVAPTDGLRALRKPHSQAKPGGTETQAKTQTLGTGTYGNPVCEPGSGTAVGCLQNT